MANEAEIVRLADALRVDRAVFGKLYDAAVRPKQTIPFIALAVLRDSLNPGLTGREKDKADFAEALRRLDSQNLLFDFVSSNAELLFESTAQANVTLQAIANFAQKFPSAQLLTLAHIKAMRRCCRIVIRPTQGAQPVKGSGFLIGPHLVLTNWHVVRAMLDPAGRELADSESAMTFEFDALIRADGSTEKIVPFRPVAKWLVASSPAHPDEISGGGSAAGGPWPANPNVLAQHLDFAVVELNGTPGRTRGYYDLADATWPIANAGLSLFQFPLGRAMTYLFGSVEAPNIFADNGHPPRIWHRINAERGSSGGLCLDIGTSVAVALHQAGYQFTQGVNAEGNPAVVAVINAAVPLAAIAQIAGQAVMSRIASAPRVKRITPTGHPIIGRGDFQNLIDRALRGSEHIISVETTYDDVRREPRSKIGKSFSATIMEALLCAPLHGVFSVTSARLTSDAYNAASYIVSTVHSQAAGGVPAAPSGQTSLDAEAIGTLVTRVIDAMKAAAGNGTLWLVIDDLDRYPILIASTTSTFISALCKAVALEPMLRVVLVGQIGRPPGLTDLPILSEKLETHLTDVDVADWIAELLAPRLPLLPQLALLMADVARSMAAEKSTDPLTGPTEAIAQVLKTHWMPRAPTFDGPGGS
uniref:Serine protease n=1 Tax=Rhodopseudomonas palustris (strain BisA53) TaxID=316055 RepID=Q07HM3_RHOP5